MRRVLLDAGLLVLLIVGNADRERVTEHKRLSSYRPEDWDLLMGTLAQFDQIVVTPNVLTEASNLVRSGDKNKKSQAAFSDVFAQMTVDAEERVETSAAVVLDADFPSLGLADAASLNAAKDDTILTADVGLYVAAHRRGLQAINFNHLRDA